MQDEKPLTREYVLKLIEEHGGPEELDLSRRDLRGINLSTSSDEPALDLHGIILEGANLQGANLQGANLWDANLQGADLLFANLQGAYLSDANLQDAELLGANLQWANLSDANLQGANLWHANLQGADLLFANLQGADLSDANLQDAELLGANLQGANLLEANLQGAKLWFSNLQGADLTGATLSKARLHRAKVSPETRLEDVNWGPGYILGEEEAKEFKEAAEVYRHLKQWHTNAGIYDIAGWFFYREMEAKRKALSWRKEPVLKLWSWVSRLLCGYGERPLLTAANAAIIILGLAAAYHFLGTLKPGTFLNSLYYSVVSFTAVGYGGWAPEPQGWAKAMGAAEAFIGVFIMSLFLVTFTRKMAR